MLLRAKRTRPVAGTRRALSVLSAGHDVEVAIEGMPPTPALSPGARRGEGASDFTLTSTDCSRRPCMTGT